MVGTRACRTCAAELTDADFQWHQPRNRPGFFSLDCKPCKRQADRARIQGRRDHVDAIKLALGCADCGYNEHPAALEFDHRPGEAKVKSVAALVTSGTLAQIDREITKCDVVCANCHRTRTAERGFPRPAGERRRPRRASREQLTLLSG